MASEANNLLFRIKVFIARFAMNLIPSEPVFDINILRSFTLKHKDFITSSLSKQNSILNQMAISHYEAEIAKPFDRFFPQYNFKKIFPGKRVLDLGCWCGGKSVSFSEKWCVKEMYGIDVYDYFIQAAKSFSSSRKNKETKYVFKKGFGEAIPFPSDYFDIIVNSDVFEHVQSLHETLAECHRVLKPGGKMFSVFPSYYHPYGAHLGFVTRTPFLQWFFSAKVLNKAYREIIKSRGESAYWYSNTNDSEDNEWQKLSGGIGINGTTFSDYRKLIKAVGFCDNQILPTPLFSVGNLSVKYPRLKQISLKAVSLLHLRILQDVLSNKVVSITVK